MTRAPTCVDHGFQKPFATIIGAQEVDPQHLFQQRILHLQKAGGGSDARAVDEDLHHPHPAGALPQPVHGRTGTDVADHGEGFTSVTAHLLRRARKGLPPSPGQNQAASLPGQRQGHGPADAASRTGDQRDLVRQ